MHDRVIIYGLSNAGVRIAEFLKEAGVSVTVVTAGHTKLPGNAWKSGVAVHAADTGDLDALNDLDLGSVDSIIFSSDDDQFNIHGALRAAEINPALRIILRVFNQKLAGKLEKSLPDVRVLSVSQVASPSFAVSALIRDSILSFSVDNEVFSFYEIQGEVLSKGLRRNVGEIEAEMNLRIVAIDGIFSPGADARIESTARIICFSRFSEAKGLNGVSHGPLAAAVDKGLGRERRLRGRGFLSDRVLCANLGVFVGIFLFSIFFFFVSERLSLINAVYFVVTVLTTVGFGDISLRESTTIAKIVGIILMLSGVSLMAILFAFITDTMIKKRIETLMGRRKMHLEGHVILCGLGDVGMKILENICAFGDRVVVVEKNPRNKFIQRLRNMSVPFIIIDATMEDALLNANVGRAKAIICATDNDLTNLESGLNALAINETIRVVLRIFDEDFARRIRQSFAIHTALSSSYIAAPAFASAALESGVMNAFEGPSGKLFVIEKRIDKKDDFDAIAERKDVRILMVKSVNGTIGFKTKGLTVVPGDRVYFVSTVPTPEWPKMRIIAHGGRMSEIGVNHD